MLTVGLFLARLPYDLEEVRSSLDGCELRDFSHIRGDQVEDLLAACRGVDALLTGLHCPTLPVALADDPGRLRYICHTRGVVHAYFPRELVAAGIRLSNWGDAPAQSVASLSFALLVSLIEQVPQRNLGCERGEKLGVWQDYPRRIAGFKVGLYGCGAIGRAMADLCHAVGMEVAIHDPWSKHLPDYARTCDSLEELFDTSWGVSVHVGLGDSTRGSVGREELERLPRGGILVNTARGAVIREDELAEVVASGRIMAGLDVCEREGKWADNPMAAVPWAIFTGHGGPKVAPPPDVPPRKWQVPDYAVANLRAFAEGGTIVNEIDLATYDRTT